MSRLSFDRADAYIRVARSGDQVLLREVADACLKAGIAKEGIDRLSRNDHQAYEAMAVVSLLLNANRYEPLLDASANHPNMDVRLTVIQLLGLSRDLSLLEPLSKLAANCSDDELTKVLSEVVGQLTPSQPEPNEQSGPEPVAYSEHMLAYFTEDENLTHPDIEEQQSGTEFDVHAQEELRLQSENEGSNGFDSEFDTRLQNESEFKTDSQSPEQETSGLTPPPIA